MNSALGLTVTARPVAGMSASRVATASERSGVRMGVSADDQNLMDETMTVTVAEYSPARWAAAGTARPPMNREAVPLLRLTRVDVAGSNVPAGFPLSCAATSPMRNWSGMLSPCGEARDTGRRTRMYAL